MIVLLRLIKSIQLRVMIIKTLLMFLQFLYKVGHEVRRRSSSCLAGLHLRCSQSIESHEQVIELKLEVSVGSRESLHLVVLILVHMTELRNLLLNCTENKLTGYRQK